MRQKFNYLFIGLLFSGLAFFSYLFLLLYSDFTPQHLEVLISFKSFILILAAFNLVGFGVTGKSEAFSFWSNEKSD